LRSASQPQRDDIPTMTKIAVTIPSTAAEIVADPSAFLKAVREGKTVPIPDFDYRAAAALTDELAEEELIEEMTSYRKNVTGVDNTIFISPRSKTRRLDSGRRQHLPGSESRRRAIPGHDKQHHPNAIYQASD
jgi:hypothetical protein